MLTWKYLTSIFCLLCQLYQFSWCWGCRLLKNDTPSINLSPLKNWLVQNEAYDTNDTVFKRYIPFRYTIFHSKGSESIIFLVKLWIISYLTVFVEDNGPHNLISLQFKESTVLLRCRGTFMKHLFHLLLLMYQFTRENCSFTKIFNNKQYQVSHSP